MSYIENHGKQEEYVIAICDKTRQPYPDWYINKPYLDFTGNYYFSAFGELSTERSVGMGVGPIPYSSIMLYCTHNYIRGERVGDFLYVIRQLDAHYLENANKATTK